MTTTAIATVNASVVLAQQPTNLQQMGALVSQGGTTETPGTATLVASLPALLALLAAPVTIASLAWSGSVVTVTTSAPHGWNNGDVIPVVISGAAPIGYNGNFTVTITGTTTFTYPLSVNPGAETSPGRATLWAVTELTQMGTTYFAGNGVPAVYVVELGEGAPDAGVTALEAFIAEVNGTPAQIYIYEVPREWATNASYQAMTANYLAAEDMLYFFTTLSGSSGAAAFAGAKSVFAQVESPGAPSTEFSMSSPLGTVLSQNPSSTQKVPPLSYAPAYGVTAYPLQGNQSVFQSLAVANVGWIGTGAQGGISSNILFQGKLLSGLPWNFWYSTDWVQIQSATALANEIINGSATSVNPLYYDQPGINRLQNRILKVFNQGVQNGLGNGRVVSTQLPIAQFLQSYNAGVYDGQLVVNAEPFLAYSAEHPGDYAIGKYAGLFGIWIPGRGFQNVFFNIQATDLIVA